MESFSNALKGHYLKTVTICQNGGNDYFLLTI